MEQVFSGTSVMPLLLAELVGLMVYSPVLISWVSRIQKLCIRYLPLILLPLLGFIALVWRIQGEEGHDDNGSRAPEGAASSKVKVVQRQRRQRRGGEHLRLSGRDVEMVTQRMGLGCGRGGGEFKDALGADDLNCLFEEKEPSLEEVKAAFRVFDRNGDGFIDAAELERVLSILGFKEGLSVDDCRRMIGAYDENKDGRIDFHEFVKLMECSFC